LYEVDFHWNGFDWIDFHDIDSSVISFLRWSKHRRDFTVWVCNFTPVVRENYRIGVPEPGVYREVLNTDWERFGGSGVRNDGELWTDRVEMHGRRQSLPLTLPPLAVTVYRRIGG
jgi:1,4-alpha-glucan branching enzyme